MRNLIVMSLFLLSACSHGPSVNPTPTPSPSVPSPSPAASPVAIVTPTPAFNGCAVVTATGIDLRGCDSSIKNQVGPICTAYAGAASIENLLKQKGVLVPDFSEPYIFNLYGEYSVDSFANEVPGEKLALADEFPRSLGEVESLTSKRLTNNKLLKITWLDDGDISKMKTALKNKHPVYLGIEVPEDMASCLASVRPTSRVTSGGHALPIVMFEDDNSNPALGGGYFGVKQSWGSGCGDKGYQYIPYSYCKKSYCYMYEVEDVQ